MRSKCSVALLLGKSFITSPVTPTLPSLLREVKLLEENRDGAGAWRRLSIVEKEREVMERKGKNQLFVIRPFFGHISVISSFSSN